MVFIVIAPDSPAPYSCANTIAGDVNGDNVVNANDIDFLRKAINEGYPDINCDLTGESLLDTADYVFLVENILNTSFGDTNLDKVINSTDNSIVNSNLDNIGGWAQGNFGLDEIVDNNDLSLTQ